MKHKTGEVTLRSLERDDAYVSVNWRNNPKIWELTLNSPDRFITLEDELAWMDKVLFEQDSHRFAILYDNTYVGNIQLTHIAEQESFYGIFIGDTRFWGKGIAKKSTNLILQYAFKKLKLKRIKLRVRITHNRAIKLYEHIGFKEIDRDESLIYMEIENNN